MNNRGSKMLFLILLGLALSAAVVSAVEQKGFIISTGEASLENTTPEDARREALNRASDGQLNVPSFFKSGLCVLIFTRRLYGT